MDKRGQKPYPVPIGHIREQPVGAGRGGGGGGAKKKVNLMK